MKVPVQQPLVTGQQLHAQSHRRWRRVRSVCHATSPVLRMRILIGIGLPGATRDGAAITVMSARLASPCDSTGRRLAATMTG